MPIFPSPLRTAFFLFCFIASLAHADIIIGQSSPLTGVAGETGSNLALGAKVYFSHINDKGGINGQKIKHVVLDDKYEIQQTLSNAKILIGQEKSLALINFYGTGNTAELIKSRQLDIAKIPLVGVYTGARAAREPFTPYIFHTRAGYHEEVQKIVEILSSLGITSVGVLYQDDPFGEAGFNAVKASLEKKPGMALVAQGSYPKLTDNVVAAAQKLSLANPQAVIMIAITKPAAAFINQFKQLGGNSQLFSISTSNFEELVRMDGVTTAHGIGVSQVFPFPYQSTLAVVREYQGLMKQYAPESKLSYASMEGFMNAKILVEGLRRAGSNPNRESLLKALEKISDFDLGDYRVSYSDSNHLGSHYVELTMINQHGQLSH